MYHLQMMVSIFKIMFFVFSFLTKAGLMKAGTNCTQLPEDIQGNGPTNEMPDSTTKNLEEMR